MVRTAARARGSFCCARLPVGRAPGRAPRPARRTFNSYSTPAPPPFLSSYAHVLLSSPLGANCESEGHKDIVDRSLCLTAIDAIRSVTCRSGLSAPPQVACTQCRPTRYVPCSQAPPGRRPQGRARVRKPLERCAGHRHNDRLRLEPRSHTVDPLSPLVAPQRLHTGSLGVAWGRLWSPAPREPGVPAGAASQALGRLFPPGQWSTGCTPGWNPRGCQTRCFSDFAKFYCPYLNVADGAGAGGVALTGVETTHIFCEYVPPLHVPSPPIKNLSRPPRTPAPRAPPHAPAARPPPPALPRPPPPALPRPPRAVTPAVTPTVPPAVPPAVLAPLAPALPPPPLTPSLTPSLAPPLAPPLAPLLAPPLVPPLAPPLVPPLAPLPRREAERYRHEGSPSAREGSAREGSARDAARMATRRATKRATGRADDLQVELRMEPSSPTTSELLERRRLSESVFSSQAEVQAALEERWPGHTRSRTDGAGATAAWLSTGSLCGQRPMGPALP